MYHENSSQYEAASHGEDMMLASNVASFPGLPRFLFFGLRSV